MPRIIYAVASGDYDDYRIEGAFSTRAKAEEYVKNHKWASKPDIEEWELDPTPIKTRRGHSWFSVSMSLSTGELVEIHKYPHAAIYADTRHDLLSPLGEDRALLWDHWRKTDAFKVGHYKAEDHKWYPANIFATGWLQAKDDKHAARLANERRVQWIIDHQLARDFVWTDIGEEKNHERVRDKASTRRTYSDERAGTSAAP